MTTHRSLVVIGFSLLLVGCTWFSGGAEPEELEVEVDPEPAAETMTFQELFRSGQDRACTFTNTVDGVITNGTVFVAADGRRLRGEFETIEANGDTTQGFIIRTGTTGYVWTSTNDQGIMMTFPEDDTSVFGQPSDDAAVGISETDPVSFNCEAWDIEPSLFEAPTDRDFIDVNAQLEVIQENMPEGLELDMKATQCAGCDQVPDAAEREQCRTALGC